MTTALQARDKSRLKPVYLVEIALKNSGPTLYLSDRNITVGGQNYEAYLTEISGVGDELRRADSEGLNPDIELRFRNDRWKNYNYLIEAGDTYPFEGAACTIKEVYLDDADTPSDAVTVFKGELDEPRDIDLKGFRVRVSSMPYAMDRRWKQGIINLTDYPNAYEDVGKVEPFVYGSTVLMPAVRTDWGAKTTLLSDITATQTTLELSDASRFPSAGTILIDDEKISYTSKSGNVLNGLTRGASGTAAKPHGAGAEAWQVKSSYDSLLASHELHSVGDIFAEIRGSLWRVTSGVSAVYEGGKHLLRATDAVRVKGVVDNIGVNDSITVNDGISINDPGHSHQAPATQIRIPTGSAKGVISGAVTWTNDHPNVRDQSDLSFCKADKNSTSGTAYIDATFPSYAGPAPSAVYLCIRHSSYVNTPGTSDYVKLKVGSSYYSIDNSSALLTQKVYYSTSTVPTSVRVELKWLDSTQAFMQVYEIWVEVKVDSTSSNASGVAKSGSVTKSGSASKTGEVISTRMVERFHAVVSGYKDTDGSYGGAGTVIQRPDHVIKHFLKTRCGFTDADIDSSSFSAAGSAYAGYITGGYKFAFVVAEKIKPSEFLKRLAFECRSALSYEAGKWYLQAIPDASPAAQKTISKGELAGENAKFRFRKTSVLDIANSLTARFSRAYTRLGSESDWYGTSKASDSASITKYGEYAKEFEFEAIRSQAMADNVLAHILKQRKIPFLLVEFPVFWEHFDLTVGDTFAIDNPLFNGKKFFIEEMRREGQGKAAVTALEWW